MLKSPIFYSQYRTILASTAGCICFCLALLACKNEPQPQPDAPLLPLPEGMKQISALSRAVLLDGNGNDTAWQDLQWQPINQIWVGKPKLDSNDFQGRYKVAYDANFLYVIAEIRDEKIVDTHTNGLDHYWDDDCLEIFIDENASGGLHQYNHQAFAYHLSLDGRVVDIAPDSSFQYFDQHVTYKRTTVGPISTWEGAFRIYKDTYTDTQNSTPLFLKRGKQMGFMLAYCDNDNSPEREHFIGSFPVEGSDKNRGWIDASTFEKVVLGDE